MATRSLEHVGRYELAVREQPGGDPPFEVYFTHDERTLSFAGIYTYGGATRAAALAEAERLAERWSWRVVE